MRGFKLYNRPLITRDLDELEKNVVIACVGAGKFKVIWTKQRTHQETLYQTNQIIQIKEKKYYCTFLKNKLLDIVGLEK